MTTETALKFGEGDQLGIVAAVDTARVMVNVQSAPLMTTLGIGHLVAIKGNTESEYLVGIIDKVSRTLSDDLEEDESTGDAMVVDSPKDVVRAVLIGTFKAVDGARRNVFKRGAESFPQVDRPCFLLQAGNLQRFMGLLGEGLDEAQRLALGVYSADKSAIALANGDKFFQRHASILGSTGSGKSWLVALLLERAAALKYPNIIVFDMHGEYAPLCEGDDRVATRFRIAGPGDVENPAEDVVFLPYWLLNRDEMLSMFLDRSDQNAPNQASRFTLHVRELKEKTLKDSNKLDVLKTFTVDSPIPYELKALTERLREDNEAKGVGAKGKPVKGDWEGKLTRFLSRLEAKLQDRRYAFLFEPPHSTLEYDWLSAFVCSVLSSGSAKPGIKIIDFSEVPSDVIPIVTAVMARLLYNVQFWMKSSSRTPFSILCDEAHLYLPVREQADSVETEALQVFERIAKEGRKYGVSLVVVSQRPSDVSRTILSQCSNFVVLRLTNDRDQAVVKRLVPDSMSALTDIIPLLDTGEALLLGDAVLLPSRIVLARPKKEPDSATRDFWSEWNSMEPSVSELAIGVEALRKQTRN